MCDEGGAGPGLPLPAGLGAYFVARHRYGSAPASGSDGDGPAVSEA